ncbi:cytochrome b5-like heme/steroid binding domain-containing protein [Spinellus fusiger]|nr:cytochrome b5-like heme/steroid binding domain-containing protein [Spinellus fusiger]
MVFLLSAAMVCLSWTTPLTWFLSNPPKDTPIAVSELAKCNGIDPSKPIYVAIKGDVFDVTKNTSAYGVGSGYNVFTGKDASRALAMSSLKPEDCIPDISGLDEKELKTLEEWHVFFSKRYDIVGKVAP